MLRRLDWQFHNKTSNSEQFFRRFLVTVATLAKKSTTKLPRSGGVSQTTKEIFALKIKWKLATAISLILIGLSAFEWSLIDRITLFLYMPISAVVWLSFLTTLIFSLIELKNYKSIGYKSLTSLSVQVFAFLVVIYVPFTAIGLNIDFKLYKTQREDVVQSVNSGVLSPNVEHNASLINLGNRYPALSAGGNEIVVEEHEGLKYVFFFTFRGILDSYAGFLYVPSGGKPNEYSDLNEQGRVEIKHLGGNWYYASHH